MKKNATPKRITLVDVAKKAHVSRATASLVLRGSNLVADETRARVLAVMDELGYVYNRAAASLRTQQSYTVGLIITDLTNPFFAQMTVGIQARLEEKGYALLLANSGDALQRQDKLIEAMYARGVDGIMLCPARGSDVKLLERLKIWQMPTVFVARYVSPGSMAESLRFDYVGADNEQGAFQAVEYFVESGHRCIAFVGGPEDSSARFERLNGYRQAMHTYKLTYDERWVIPSPVTREGGYQIIDALLDADDRPTALLCYNDVIALGAMMRMQSLGVQPGEDIAIIGFDDIDEASFWRPALSSVSVMPRRLGEHAAEALLNRMGDPERSAQRQIFPSRLIIRESSNYKGDLS